MKLELENQKVVAVKVNMGSPVLDFLQYIIEIEQKIEMLDSKKDLLIFDRNLEGKAFLFKADSKEDMIDFQEKYLYQIKEICHAMHDVCFAARTLMVFLNMCRPRSGNCCFAARSWQ